MALHAVRRGIERKYGTQTRALGHATISPSAGCRNAHGRTFRRAGCVRVRQRQAKRNAVLQGNLILTVALNRDGGIKSVDIIESSGRKLLDDAAIRIVRLAAPFPPIPRTDEKVDELYITRTYQFLRGGTLETH